MLTSAVTETSRVLTVVPIPIPIPMPVAVLPDPVIWLAAMVAVPLAVVVGGRGWGALGNLDAQQVDLADHGR
jgi:hypothetical protein